MWQSLALFAVLIVQAYSAPQFITFQDGKLGVNFGGYHAGVGLGGLLGGGDAAGGLFAEAGTPFGQAAKAGLGGSVGGSGRSAGGLYAGATAGGNVKAEAGLGGAVGVEKSIGGGFASASAGSKHAAAGLGGETLIAGSSGFSLSGSKSIEVPTVVKETKVSVVPVLEEKYEITNEITPVASAGVEANAGVGVNIDAHKNVQPSVIVKEVSKWSPRQYHRPHEMLSNIFKNVIFSVFPIPPVENHSQMIWPAPRQIDFSKQVYVEPQPTKVIEKHIIHTVKPHRHHFHKTAYIGGYIGGGADVAAPHQVLVQPNIERRIDTGVEATSNIGAVANVGAAANVGANKEAAGGITYTKHVSVASNPKFFEDIFNIPISTLKAVSSLLSNVAGNTNVSVQKSASVHAGLGAAAESDLISSKHASSSPTSSSSSSEAHISVQTPSASKVISDIFSIPINTLTAVNNFLGNLPARKRVQVSQDETAEPTKIRLGPHARRRANKKVFIVEETSDPHSV